MEFLKAHRNHLEALAREVLQKETLSAEEIDEILRREDDRKIA